MVKLYPNTAHNNWKNIYWKTFIYNVKEMTFIHMYLIDVQSTLHISMSKFISNYRYLKVNFLVPENLLWDTSSLRKKKLKCKEKQEIPWNYIQYLEKSVFDIQWVNCIYSGKTLWTYVAYVDKIIHSRELLTNWTRYKELYVNLMNNSPVFTL